MRAVITGGAGFLGSHLCELMLEKGWDVLCLDNLVTGTDSNIAHLLPHPKFRFARQDVSRYIEVQGPVEAVLHFASPASPPDYLKYPIQTLKVGALAWLIQCAVKRCWSTVGESPTRELVRSTR